MPSTVHQAQTSQNSTLKCRFLNKEQPPPPTPPTLTELLINQSILFLSVKVSDLLRLNCKIKTAAFPAIIMALLLRERPMDSKYEGS